MTKRSGGRFITLSIVAVLALTGCSDDDSTVDAGSDDSTEATAGDATSDDDSGAPAEEATTSTSQGLPGQNVGEPVQQEGTEADPIAESSDGMTASIAVGEKLFIKLETCPSCGYSWRAEDGTDAKIVKLVSEDTKARPQPAGEAPMTGRPEDYHAVYQGVAAGQTTITLGYFPPGGDKAEKTFSIKVAVTA